MRSSFVSDRGAPLTRTLNVRQQAARRWTIALGAMGALALGSAFVGALTAPGNPEAEAPRTGPLSYLSEQ